MSQDYDSIAITDVLTTLRTKVMNRDDASSSWFIGDDEPTTTFSGQPWIDTTSSPNLIKVRNSTNTDWITIGNYDTNLGHMPLSGGIMAGNIAMGTHKITNLDTPTLSDDMARKVDADNQAATLEPVNKGRLWISHGDNVITFATPHDDTDYVIKLTLGLANMGGVTTRAFPHTLPMPVYSENETVSRCLVRVNGGYGFTSCGYIAAISGVTEQYDDVANTHTARAASTARSDVLGYSVNGLGFTSCGWIEAITGTTERFDNAANTHTARTAATARYRASGYSLNGYGFSSCGYIAAITGTTERFDDEANTHTARTAATARVAPIGYGLNNYGFISCGYVGPDPGVGTTERFDDEANTHTARADATARYFLGGYSLGGYGFTICGYTTGAAGVGTNEQFDDEANNHSSKTSASTRWGIASFGLNGFGFTCVGYSSGNVQTVQRYDKGADAHTTRANGTARRQLAGYATNEFFLNYVTFNA